MFTACRIRDAGLALRIAESAAERVASLRTPETRTAAGGNPLSSHPPEGVYQWIAIIPAATGHTPMNRTYQSTGLKDMCRPT
ncbi:hypothetical protein KRMM14A1259_22120 [Krasilnikovia sp. MM14-A1259]